jgi:hypothetical protein
MCTVTVLVLWPGLLIFQHYRLARMPEESRLSGVTPLPSPPQPRFAWAHRHVHTHICELQHPPALLLEWSLQCQNRHYFTWKECSISTLLKPCQGKKNRSCDFSMPSAKLDWASALWRVSVVRKQTMLGLNGSCSHGAFRKRRHFWGLLAKGNARN